MASPVTILKFRALIPTPGALVENGELVIAGDRIREIRAGFHAPAGAGVLDLSDHLLLPGFVNAHCHLSLSALRGRLHPEPRFTDWVRQLLAADGAISRKDRVRALQEGAREMLTSGVTSLGDYVPDPGLLSEYAALPLRQVAFLETLGFQAERAPEILERLRLALESHADPDGRFRLGLGPHAPYSVSPELFRGLARLASCFEVPISCHVAEFPEEVRFLKEGGGELEEFLKERGVLDAAWQAPGRSPPAYLDQLGVLENLAAVHLNFADGDLDLLKTRGVSAVFCPGSTRWFGRTRFLPARRLLDRGVAVALGTDSLASNESLNYLRELRLADAMLPEVSRAEILDCATRGGAQALGLETGAIAPGRPADLVGFRVAGIPASWEDVPFAPERERADFVMVEGKSVFTSGSE